MFLASLCECRKLVIWKGVKFSYVYFSNEELRGEELIENVIRIYFSIFASAVFFFFFFFKYSFLELFFQKGCCLYGMQFSAFFSLKEKKFLWSEAWIKECS